MTMGTFSGAYLEQIVVHQRGIFIEGKNSVRALLHLSKGLLDKLGFADQLF